VYIAVTPFSLSFLLLSFSLSSVLEFKLPIGQHFDELTTYFTAETETERRAVTTSTMPEVIITGWDTRDVRFPTSLDKTGSDAMNAAGDYSAAYCILKTDSQFSGHGMVTLPSPPPTPNPYKQSTNLFLLHKDLHHRAW
jgi:hypothetical protein